MATPAAEGVEESGGPTVLGRLDDMKIITTEAGSSHLLLDRQSTTVIQASVPVRV